MKMKINEKYFLSGFILFLVISIFYNLFIYDKLNKYESKKFNNMILKNASKLEKDELIKNNYNQLNLLKDLYIDNGEIDSALEIIELEIRKNNSIDLENYIYMINLSEDNLDFNKAMKYSNEAYELMNINQKLNCKLRFSEYALAQNNIELSIQYCKEALEILNLNINSSSYSNDLNNINKKIKFLEDIKENFYSDDPKDSYKEIIKATNIIYLPSVCKYLLENYKNNYSSHDQTGYLELKALYEKYR